jgi:hypothetical protein
MTHRMATRLSLFQSLDATDLLRSILMALALTTVGCTFCEPTIAGSVCTDNPVANCPNDLPASCVTPAPSYETDVSPVIAAYCLTCHSPGGQEASYPLVTYDQVYATRSQVLDQIYSCRMPPNGQAQPTEAERLLVLQWLVCGAPQN